MFRHAKDRLSGAERASFGVRNLTFRERNIYVSQDKNCTLGIFAAPLVSGTRLFRGIDSLSENCTRIREEFATVGVSGRKLSSIRVKTDL